ncbi:MAG: PASTA domain-containing protein [Bacteroidota bacterium]
MSSKESIKKVLKNTVETVKTAASDLYYFLSSKIFLKNAVGAIILSVLLLVLSFQFLKMYTRHGETITLPDFTGMTIDKVEQQLKNKHLKYGVIDSVYSAADIPGAILDQDPPANSKVKENRTIYFTVNPLNPPKVMLPNIWNVDYKFARNMLLARGLEVDEENIRYKKDKAEDTILDVIYDGETLKKPPSGTRETPYRIPKGTKLGLVVAEGGGGEVIVPKLTCNTYDEAIFKIRSSNLNIGAIIADQTVTDTLAAFVYRQNPTSSGQFMRMGEQIDIWITQDKPAGCTEWDIFDEDTEEGSNME